MGLLSAERTLKESIHGVYPIHLEETIEIEGEQAEDSDIVEALKRLAERELRIHRVTRDLEMGRNK